MEVECHRVKLKPNSLPLLEAWAACLKEEVSSVRELLKKEGVIVESVFLEQTSEGDFLIYYLRSHDLKKAREISKASTHALDLYHQKIMKEVSLGGNPLPCLLDIAEL